MEKEKSRPNPDPDYIEVDYFIESELPLDKSANDIAEGQTFATWVKVTDDAEKIKKEFGGKVLAVKEEKSDKSSGLYSGLVRIAFPWRNFGPRIPNLISNLFGELFEIKTYKKIKVLDIHMPDKYINQFRGPQFGLERTKELIRFEKDRPMVGAILKPCLGLTNAEIANLAYEVALGGVDFIKDDEIVGDNYFSTVEDRVRQVIRALKRAEEKTGQKVMYAVSITDRVDMLKELHDQTLAEEGNCVMVNVSAVGLSALRVLAEKTKLPIHCHRVFTPAYTRCAHWGLSMKVFMKLVRLAGGDQIHCGAIGGKLYESDSEVLENAKICLDKMGNLRQAMPVNSGRQWAGTVPQSLKAFGHNDYLHLFGGGIFGHPGGAQAGAKSVIQAYEASKQGIPLEDYAKRNQELKQALTAFEK